MCVLFIFLTGEIVFFFVLLVCFATFDFFFKFLLVSL